MTAKRWIRRIVTLCLLGGLVWLVARRDGFEGLGARLADLEPAWLVLALVAPLVAVAASVLRWRTLLRAEGVELPLRFLLGSFLRGRFIGVFTPSTLGLDVYRVMDASARAGRRATHARVVVLEKFYGLVALALVTLAVAPLGASRLLGAGGLWLAAALGAASLGGIALLVKPAPVLRRLPAFVRRRAAVLLEGGGLRAGTLAGALAASVVTHLAASVVFVGTGMALGVASPFALLVCGNAIVLATLLPISVAGLGVREGTAAVLLAQVGVAPLDATLLALLGFLAIQPAALVGGLTMLTRREQPTVDASAAVA